MASLLAGVSSALDTVTSNLTNTLSQTAQNGGGTLGTLDQPLLPKFRVDGGVSLSLGTPWGQINASAYNPYTSAPDTDITRYYSFDVAPCTIAPDGVEAQDQVCVNGHFPGPLIEANYGDWIEVKVNNNFDHGSGEGTTIHWHGFLQVCCPWSAVCGVLC